MQEYEMRVNQDKITFKDKANEKQYTSFLKFVKQKLKGSWIFWRWGNEE